jgi:hypothetical protein
MLLILLILFANTSFTQDILTRVDSISQLCYWVEQGDTNPFSPTTTLDFSFPDSSLVDIEVQRISIEDKSMSINGYVVIRKLVHQRLSKGYYRILWDMKDSSGSRVEKGLYIFHLIITREYGVSIISFEARTKQIPL